MKLRVYMWNFKLYRVKYWIKCFFFEDREREKEIGRWIDRKINRKRMEGKL